MSLSDKTPSSSSRNGSSSNNEENNAVAIVVSLIQCGIAVSASIWFSRWLARKLQEDQMSRPGNSRAVQRLVNIMRRRGLVRLPELSSYEQSMAEDVVDPEELQTEFKDIGGLDEIKQELWQLAVLPLKRPDLFSDNSLVQPPKGILLYGKPGTG